MMKRMVSVALMIALALMCAACGAKEAPAASEGPVALEGFPWSVELRAAAVQEALHTAAGMKQYDGSVLDVAYDDEPTAGNVYLILTLTVAKTEAGGGSFDWSNLSVRDADGGSYARMADDAFIQNHTYNRMPGTTLQIGENKGSICFEIPADAAKGDLTLVYDAGDAGEIAIAVKPE